MSNVADRQGEAPDKCAICGKPAWNLQAHGVSRMLCDDHQCAPWRPLSDNAIMLEALTVCAAIQATRGKPYEAINRIRRVALDAIAKVKNDVGDHVDQPGADPRPDPSGQARSSVPGSAEGRGLDGGGASPAPRSSMLRGGQRRERDR